MNYFEKLENNPYEDLNWNIPERQTGTVNVIGGNAGNFRTEIKIAEYMASIYPLQEVKVVVPGALKGKLPNLSNIVFLPSTDSGGFAESQELINIFDVVDFNLVLGDLSKNKITGHAIANAVKDSEKMLLLTRDAIDVLVDNMPERWLMNENVMILASIAQLQKLLRSVYYPKMLLMSSSLIQIADVLHKFTLSYPVEITTLHNGQVIVAKNGIVKAVALEKAGYSPIMFWNGEVASKIVGMNLYNPSKFIEATIDAIMQ